MGTRTAIAAGSAVRAALMHVAAPEEAEHLRPLVEAQYTVREWLTTQLSPALGVHSGTGTVGVALIPDGPPPAQFLGNFHGWRGCANMV